MVNILKEIVDNTYTFYAKAEDLKVLQGAHTLCYNDKGKIVGVLHKSQEMHSIVLFSDRLLGSGEGKFAEGGRDLSVTFRISEAYIGNNRVEGTINSRGWLGEKLMALGGELDEIAGLPTSFRAGKSDVDGWVRFDLYWD